MNKVAIIGVGNIGFRHFQATCGASGVDEILIFDPAEERIELALQAKEATGKKVLKLKSVADLVEVENLSVIISAVTTDIQAEIFKYYIDADPRFILLEKPLGQSRAILDSLNGRARGRENTIYVNCGRNLGAGMAKIKSAITDKRVHLEVSGNNWGLGCNLVHFIEIFRFLTNARRIETESAQISVSRYPNKRGPQYEEFLGTAAFTNDHGDSLQVTCGDVGTQPSSIQIMVRERGSDEAWFLVEEKSRRLNNLKTFAHEPLGDLFVSESTRIVLESLLGKNPTAIPLPNLKEASVSHEAYFSALAMGLGRSEFKVT